MARTLEWSLPSPAPEYNFARTPVIHGRDEWWYIKKGQFKQEFVEPEIQPIHMPKNSGRPFLLGVSFFVMGFGFVFERGTVVVVGVVGILAILIARSFEFDYYHYIPVDVVKRTEKALGRL